MDNKERHIQIIVDLPFTKENFDVLKRELIWSILSEPKTISQKVEDATSGIADRKWEEDMIEDMVKFRNFIPKK